MGNDYLWRTTIRSPGAVLMDGSRRGRLVGLFGDGGSSGATMAVVRMRKSKAIKRKTEIFTLECIFVEVYNDICVFCFGILLCGLPMPIWDPFSKCRPHGFLFICQQFD